jgi:hypothetical protein
MDEPKAIGITLEITPELEKGVYANLGFVSFRDTEITLDFLFVQPQAPKAKCVARVITSALHAKRLLLALQDNVAKFERAFGEIRDPNPPRFETQGEGPLS